MGLGGLGLGDFELVGLGGFELSGLGPGPGGLEPGGPRARARWFRAAHSSDFVWIMALEVNGQPSVMLLTLTQKLREKWPLSYLHKSWSL